MLICSPYYMESVIAGTKNGRKYLGYVDMFGTYFENDYLITGIARYFCGHLINESWNPEADLATCMNVIQECFKVMYYRSKNQSTSVIAASVTEQGIVRDKTKINVEFSHDMFVNKPHTI